MEESKSKEVKMGVASGNSQDNNNPPKYTYEQLNDLCGKLYQENQQLKQQLQQSIKYIQTFNRLDYLFKVVEITSKESKASEYTGFAKDFVESCVAEIQELMTIPEEKSEETKEN